jgi:hypothetical protein
MSPADELRQRLGLAYDPAGDVFGFPWSSWTRVPAKAPVMTAAQVVEASRTVRLKAVDPRQMELAV